MKWEYNNKVVWPKYTSDLDNAKMRTTIICILVWLHKRQSHFKTTSADRDITSFNKQEFQILTSIILKTKAISQPFLVIHRYNLKNWYFQKESFPFSEITHHFFSKLWFKWNAILRLVKMITKQRLTMQRAREFFFLFGYKQETDLLTTYNTSQIRARKSRHQVYV